jgi:hypothetical protein
MHQYLSPPTPPKQLFSGETMSTINVILGWMQALRDGQVSQPPALDLSSTGIKPQDVHGRVVVVTGANIGLGFEAAKHFAAMKPAHLVLGCRSLEKGNKAVEGIF